MIGVGKTGNCPACGGVFKHLWLDYLGWTDDWYMKCNTCRKEYHTLYNEVDKILDEQPHIIISRS